MTKREVQQTIENALKVVREYRRQEQQKPSRDRRLFEESEIREFTDELIKESYMLGSSGSPCPRCGGSGRV